MRKGKAGLYVVAACVAVSALWTWMPTQHVKADGASLVGAWMVTTMPNTPPGTPGITFSELAIFNAGGTWTDTHAIAHNSENPATLPGLAVDSGDAYGSWQRLGDTNQFAATFKRLLFAGTNTPMTLYGPFFPGQHVGFETGTVVLTLTSSSTAGDTLQGPFTVQFSNLAGQVTFADTGTVTAKRLPAAPVTAN